MATINLYFQHIPQNNTKYNNNNSVLFNQKKKKKITIPTNVITRRPKITSNEKEWTILEQKKPRQGCIIRSIIRVKIIVDAAREERSPREEFQSFPIPEAARWLAKTKSWE